MSTEILTQARLKSVLDYDPLTGVFTRLKSSTRPDRIGKPAGGVSPSGYHRISVLGGYYQTHQLVWMWVYGRWPDGELDHKDRNRANNRLSNLVDGTKAMNQHNRGVQTNNCSGYRGVSWCNRTCKWVAQIRVNKKTHFLGRHTSAAKASEIYEAAKRIYHPTASL